MTSTRIIICTFLVATIAVGTMQAQQNSQVSSILDKYKNWRYGMISVFRVNEEDGTVNKLNMLLGPPEPVIPEEAKLCNKKDEIEEYVLSGGEGADEKEYQKWMRAAGCKAYERYFSQRIAWEKAQFKKAFVVTTRYQPGEPFRVIALLVQKNTESFYGLRQDLDPPSGKYLANELEAKQLDEQILVSGVAKKGREILETTTATLYEYLTNQVVQGNLENVTPEAQGIGEEGIRFVKKKYGTTEGINEDSSPLYMRITEGLPQNYQNNNEIIVSALDGVSYRRFERPVINDGEIDSAVPTNAYLPKYGVELKYGLEDINYPSIWSERLTLNAVWGASHLGVVLPTNGWSNISKDLGATQRMTTGGMGINGAFDFPIRVISESGVFHVGGSYVFSDAVKTDHQVYNIESNLNEDYLVRFHATMQYTFAIRIDESFMFRMRLGGTIYNMESWATTAGQDLDTAVIYRKVDNQTVGGLSGAVDFMATAWSTPVGFTLSYFDETILGKAWLQVPIMDQFAVRFDARIFAPVFRDPRQWENDAVVMPAVNFIFNF
ncbi:MAG TPA: hypothetical protein VK147_09265 [Candidatus Didemnitutus sp.]|nr:hypothetical protein [Candidatus Didemnitutus sp.]